MHAADLGKYKIGPRERGRSQSRRSEVTLTMASKMKPVLEVQNWVLVLDKEGASLNRCLFFMLVRARGKECDVITRHYQRADYRCGYLTLEIKINV